MAVLFSPFGNSQYFDQNGDPAIGFTVETYASGSSSPLATYTSSTGLVANATSVTLNAAGLNPAGQFWLTSGLAYKFIVKDAGGIVVQTVNGVTGVNDPALISATDQWAAYSGTPTYISATSFSVAGDQTSTFQVGRRVKTTNTGGTVYSTIATSVFGAVTTVTVVNDSGTLDVGLSAVSYGLLSALNPSIPETTIGKAVRATSLGGIVDRAYVEYATNANIATVIPFDNTIPQNTEGTQILSVSLTPKSATNRVRLRFQGVAAGSVAPLNVVAAIFTSASASAIAATHVTLTTVDEGKPLVCEVEYVPGVTTALTYTVRVGPQSASNIRLNGSSAAQFLGGAEHATLVVEEIAV